MIDAPAATALLPDAVKDQVGLATEDIIREHYGDRVADLIVACPDSVWAGAEAAGASA